MPKFVLPRSQRRNVEPYDRLPRSKIASLWATNAEIKGLKTQLDTIKAEEKYLKADYDLINEMVEVMSRHVERLLNGFEDHGEARQEELLRRLQMMNIQK